MSYILVTADFPNIITEQRKKIYLSLTEKNWCKIYESGKDIDSVWQFFFNDTVSEANAILASINDFVECSKPFCKPSLVLHWGSNRPTRYNLIS